MNIYLKRKNGGYAKRFLQDVGSPELAKECVRDLEDRTDEISECLIFQPIFDQQTRLVYEVIHTCYELHIPVRVSSEWHRQAIEAKLRGEPC